MTKVTYIVLLDQKDLNVGSSVCNISIHYTLYTQGRPLTRILDTNVNLHIHVDILHLFT